MCQIREISEVTIHVHTKYTFVQHYSILYIDEIDDLNTIYACIFIYGNTMLIQATSLSTTTSAITTTTSAITTTAILYVTHV